MSDARVAPNEDESMAGSLPTKLGSFLLVRRLGRGGMGDVFLARQELKMFERPCVVKLLRRAHTKSSVHVNRFLDEARTTLLLSHKNVCPVLDVGTADGKVFLAMEHIAGRDLRAILRRSVDMGRLVPPAIAAHVFGEVLDALDYAHTMKDPTSGKALGLVHRDVTPHNVMVAFAGVVKLIDFGVAQSAAQLTKTDPGLVVGKLHYMSPEQANGTDVDGKSDVFAAAILAYELFVADRFYPSKSPDEVGQMLDEGTYVPPKWDLVPDGIKPLLKRALALRAEDRPTAAELRRELLAWQMQEKLVVDTAAVRTYLAELFPGAEDDDRKMLAAASTDPNADEGERDETGATMTSTAGARASQVEQTVPARARSRSGTRPAREPSMAARPRSKAPLLAGLASAAVVAIVAVVVLQPAASAPEPIVLSAVDPSPNPIATPVATTVTPPKETAEAPDPTDPTDLEPEPVARAAKRVRTKQPRDPKPEQVEPVVVEKPALPERPRLLAARVRYASAHCAQLACSAEVNKQFAAIGRMSADEADALKASVDKCLDQCGAP